MRSSLLARGMVLGAFFTAFAAAQTFPFQLRATSGNQVALISNQSTLAVSATVGQSQSITITATYVGSGKITISQSPSILGSPEFNSTVNGTLPLTLNPGDSFTDVIVFTPTSSSQATAIFSQPFTETVPGVGNQPPTTTTSAITLSLVGSAASFVLSYIKNGNVVPLTNGGTMVFDPQPIDTTVALLLNITNNGSATGSVTSITSTGAKFKLIGLPLFPANIQGGQTLQVGVEYSPTAVGSDTGQVVITFSDGTSATINLQGSGTSASLVYTLIQNGTSTNVTPGGTITLPDTDVGSTSSAVLRVQNTGNGTVTINSINEAGPAFQLSDLPLLPKVLKTNDSFTFTINFTPTTPGVLKGQLLVGTDLFNLVGKGLGSLLEFSYVSGGVKQTIGKNGISAVVFSPVQVTKSETIPFTAKNIGTLPAVISNIAIADPNSPFKLSGLPTLPVTVQPGASVSFNVVFEPTATGLSSGTLLINTTPISLSGSGTAPPPLPAYTISGPSGTVAPQTQSAVSLKLASPYPVTLEGVLTLTTSGTLGSDPAVQFSTGGATGRTVRFTIPANTTQADFEGQGSQIFIQTGTVASTVTLTPTFTTTSGIVLTPANPTTLQFTIPAAAPVLIAGVETQTSNNAVVLSFTGFSTTRSLTSLDVHFTPAPGFTLASPDVHVDLHQAATLWFQSAASQAFGGQFSVTVAFTFSGTVPTGQTLLQTIASFSATVSNETGTSNSVTGPIQ